MTNGAARLVIGGDRLPPGALARSDAFARHHPAWCGRQICASAVGLSCRVGCARRITAGETALAGGGNESAIDRITSTMLVSQMRLNRGVHWLIRGREIYLRG